MAQPKVRLPQSAALIQSEPAAGTQGRTGEDRGEIGCRKVLDRARLVRRLSVFLQRILKRHNTILGAPAPRAPAANRDAMGEAIIKPGSVGSGLPSGNELANVQAKKVVRRQSCLPTALGWPRPHAGTVAVREPALDKASRTKLISRPGEQGLVKYGTRSRSTQSWNSGSASDPETASQSGRSPPCSR